jgi:hypothetical protein
LALARTNGHDPEPPTLASPSDEASLIACLIIDTPGSVESITRADLKGNVFDDLSNRKWFETLLDMAADNDPVTPENVFGRIGHSRENTDKYQLLLNADPFPLKAEDFIPKLKDLFTRRLVISAAKQAELIARDLTVPSGAIMTDFQQAIANITPRSKVSLPEMVDATDFLEKDFPEPKQLIRGLVHRGSKLAIGGGSKSFKTWTLLNLAVSVASGSDWMGFETTQGKVLYCNFEIPEFAWQRRLQKVLTARSITLQRGSIMLWNLRGRAAQYQTLLPMIRDAAQEHNFDLDILDPIYKLYGDTDENAAGDVAQLMNSIEDLAVRTQSCVAFGAHFSKGNQSAKESIDRISGSGVFARDPDSILVMTKHEEENAFTVESTLRNLPPVEPFVVRWDCPLMVPDKHLDPTKLKQISGRKKERTEDDLLAILGDKNMSTQDWRILAQNESGIKERTFYTLKRALQESDRVFQSSVTHYWQRVNKK